MKRTLLITAALAAIAAPAAAQQMLADANHDGVVSKAEFQTYRRNLLMRADTNKDGKISQAEWKAGQIEARKEIDLNGIYDSTMIGKEGWFAAIDANHDGFITPAEIDAATAKRFAAFDIDHDGKMNQFEAQRAESMSKKAPK